MTKAEDILEMIENAEQIKVGVKSGDCYVYFTIDKDQARRKVNEIAGAGFDVKFSILDSLKNILYIESPTGGADNA